MGLREALAAARPVVAVPAAIADRLDRLAAIGQQRREAVTSSGVTKFDRGPARPKPTGDPAVDGPALEQWRAATAEYQAGMKSSQLIGEALRREVDKWAAEAGQEFIDQVLAPAADHLAAEARPFLAQLAKTDLTMGDPAGVAARGTQDQIRAYRRLLELQATYALIRDLRHELLPYARRRENWRREQRAIPRTLWQDPPASDTPTRRRTGQAVFMH